MPKEKEKKQLTQKAKKLIPLMKWLRKMIIMALILRNRDFQKRSCRTFKHFSYLRVKFLAFHSRKFSVDLILEQCTDTMVEPFLFSLSNEKYFYDYIAHPDAFFFAWLTPTSVMASDRPNRVL